jgi:hypothetical protein
MSDQFSNSIDDNYEEEQTLLSKKRNKKNEMSWSFEEEFLFFEAHTFLGNKWKKYSQIIHK